MFTLLGAVTMRFLVFFACVILCASAFSDDFAQFRGSNYGVEPEQAIPTNWSITENLAWKVPVPGAGWSQPIVFGDRVYVTSAVSEQTYLPKNFSDGTKTPQSMGLGFFSKPPNFNFQWKLFCYSLEDGKEIWSQALDSGKPKFAIHPSNTYATESPAADSDGVYVYFASTGKVAGVSHEGQLMWERSIGIFKTSNNFGTGSSVALHEGKVFIQNFTTKSANVYCLDTKTGDTIWENKGEKGITSWTSPSIWKNNKRTELIISSEKKLDSYNPADGSLLWTVKNIKTAATATPCADSQRIFFGGSDPFEKGPLFAIEAGAEGDLSPKKRNTEFQNCSWIAKRSGPGMSSPVTNGKFLYVVDSNILRCYDALTGERLYQERIPKSGSVAASPLIIGNQLLILDEDGKSSLVSLGPEFEIVGGGKIDDTFWSTPAVANGSIYLRGIKFLYCIRK